MNYGENAIRSAGLRAVAMAAVLAAALMFCVCMLLASPRAAFAANEKWFGHDYFEYIVEADDSVTIMNYFGTEEVVQVPDMISGRVVSKIAKGAFAGKKTVKEVQLPATIMEIEAGAFSDGINVVLEGVVGEKGVVAEGGGPATEQDGQGRVIVRDPQLGLTITDVTDRVQGAEVDLDGPATAMANGSEGAADSDSGSTGVLGTTLIVVAVLVVAVAAFVGISVALRKRRRP